MVVILVHHDGSPLRSAIASATPQRLSTAPVASTTTAPLPALPPRRHTDPTPHHCRPCRSPSISIWKKIVRDAADPGDLVCIRGPGSEDGHRGEDRCGRGGGGQNPPLLVRGSNAKTMVSSSAAALESDRAVLLKAFDWRPRPVHHLHCP